MEWFAQSIELWSLYLPDHRAGIAFCRNLLTGQELERAAKFIHPSAGNQFILCRGLVRQVLANCLQTDPASLRFRHNAQGKPFLENGELEFNISHSRDRLLVAVTTGRAIGADIEFRRNRLHMDAIAQRCFSPEEQAYVQSLETPARGFFELWTKKEAYVKALGIGIFQNLPRLTVPIGEEPYAPVSGHDPRWFFQRVNIAPDYAAAIVSEAPAVPLPLHHDLDEVRPPVK